MTIEIFHIDPVYLIIKQFAMFRGYYCGQCGIYCEGFRILQEISFKDNSTVAIFQSSFANYILNCQRMQYSPITPYWRWTAAQFFSNWSSFFLNLNIGAIFAFQLHFRQLYNLLNFVLAFFINFELKISQKKSEVFFNPQQ